MLVISTASGCKTTQTETFGVKLEAAKAAQRVDRGDSHQAPVTGAEAERAYDHFIKAEATATATTGQTSILSPPQ